MATGPATAVRHQPLLSMKASLQPWRFGISAFLCKQSAARIMHFYFSLLASRSYSGTEAEILLKDLSWLPSAWENGFVALHQVFSFVMSTVVTDLLQA